jgi:hypothetical protein
VAAAPPPATSPAPRRRSGRESCLAINSPGGSPVQSELIASRIIELAKEKDIFNILSESIAPSIEGSFNVKKGILL